jgi:hypothetical protein
MPMEIHFDKKGRGKGNNIFISVQLMFEFDFAISMNASLPWFLIERPMRDPLWPLPQASAESIMGIPTSKAK